MFGSDIIEVVIGLVFVYFIMSLLCSTITEFIARIVAMRAKTLKDGIKRLLNDDTLRDRIFNHPLISGSSPKKNNKGPSNISSRTFSLVLFDTIMSPPDSPDSEASGVSKPKLDTAQQVIENFEKKIDEMPESQKQTKQVLNTLLISAKTHTEKWEGVLTEFQNSIEKWFDDSMDRVSGWYKRKSQLIILGIAIVFCLALNIDTFAIANNLFQDTTLRASVVTIAETQAQQDQADIDIAELREELSGLDIPMGWSDSESSPNRAPTDFSGWIIKILGILFTAFAVSLGSSFWFDLLGKIVNMRSAGKKPNNEDKTKTKNINQTVVTS